jgi:hypothetical protein
VIEALGAGLAALAAPAVQAPGPGYSAAQLHCAAFVEEVATELLLQRTGGTAREEGARTGRIQVRARTEGPAIRVEFWYDSLRLWRDTPEGRLTPDTDGLIGGRWRGMLGPSGAAALDTRPFMPPEVLAAADLSETFTDFLPPLPPRALALGAEWRDPAGGLAVERLPDSLDAPELRRYGWRAEAGGRGDSLLRLGERVVDEGVVVVHPQRGPVAWDRLVTVRSQVRAGARVGEALNTQVTQRIRVRRVTNPEACG